MVHQDATDTNIAVILDAVFSEVPMAAGIVGTVGTRRCIEIGEADGIL